MSRQASGRFPIRPSRTGDVRTPGDTVVDAARSLRFVAIRCAWLRFGAFSEHFALDNVRDRDYE